MKPDPGLRSGDGRLAGLGGSVLRRGLVFLAVSVLVGLVVGWYLGRDRLPAEIRMATGEAGGLYYKVAVTLAPHLERQTGRKVSILESKGSVENRQLLLGGEADLAILQAGTIELDGLTPLAPLYYDVVHVIVRIGSGIESMGDLSGRAVSMGRRGSGMRHSALRVLQHYRLDPQALQQSERYFFDLLSDETLDAAVVTTGLLNPDLKAVLATGDFTLLPILDADALAIHHPSFTRTEIPRGFYREGPPVPPEDVLTVGMTSFLAAPSGVSRLLVKETLRAIYENQLRTAIPVLFKRSEAAGWDDLALDPAARSFFEPYGGLGILTNFMESLAALKELLFALGAGLYLLWTQWRRVQARNRAAALQAQKDRLDVFLQKTVEIERQLGPTSEPGRLGTYLDQITELKLKALDELTDEELRGDVAFTIFLQQCSELTRKLEVRLSSALDP